MNAIVEHVKRAMIDGSYRRQAEMERLSELFKAQRMSMELDERAKDAIRATLQYVRTHITDAMLEASRRTGVPDVYLPTDDADKFRAMIDAVLLENEATA